MRWTVWFGPISNESDITLEADGFIVAANGDLMLWAGTATSAIAAFSAKTWTTILPDGIARPVKPATEPRQKAAKASDGAEAPDVIPAAYKRTSRARRPWGTR